MWRVPFLSFILVNMRKRIFFFFFKIRRAWCICFFFVLTADLLSKVIICSFIRFSFCNYITNLLRTILTSYIVQTPQVPISSSPTLVYYFSLIPYSWPTKNCFCFFSERCVKVLKKTSFVNYATYSSLLFTLCYKKN